MATEPSSPGEPRSLPPGALMPSEAREPLWIHGSLAIGPTKLRRIKMLTRRRPEDGGKADEAVAERAMPCNK